jgi:hypothetical protein
VHVHGQPGSAHLLQQRIEAGERRLRRELEPVVAAHRPEQPAHLRERPPPGLLDVPERVAVLFELVRQAVAHGAHLEDHDAQGVGDDVVQLPRDPHALLCDRDARRRLPLALRLPRALLGRVGLRGALAQGEAGEPGDRDEERDEDELARRVRRVVVHDDRRAAHCHGEADPRLGAVGEVPEQERRREPDG